VELYVARELKKPLEDMCIIDSKVRSLPFDCLVWLSSASPLLIIVTNR